jgi:hypothetical protein
MYTLGKTLQVNRTETKSPKFQINLIWSFFQLLVKWTNIFFEFWSNLHFFNQRKHTYPSHQDNCFLFTIKALFVNTTLIFWPGCKCSYMFIYKCSTYMQGFQYFRTETKSPKFQINLIWSFFQLLVKWTNIFFEFWSNLHFSNERKHTYPSQQDRFPYLP